ncbi:CHAP domain-containing protein [Acidomonas methanolica]|uniref:CHAP domain-containing protein n=1 Tax=Acidomonas methanolica TaxID=437 RepID=UPI002119BA57|nr:CHAP domain-containing protein [Acidomonas methanolica]MCQ9155761.1 CHAP domain-containing protein [Acidomonas methanolica]
MVLGLLAPKAEARHHITHHRAVAQHGHATHHYRRVASARHSGGHVIQCVAFAKSASDVVLKGNAADWWYNARGVYARGQTPEPGSVLNFRAIRRMPLGHVAVVREVESNRSIIIDHSHWGQRGIARHVRVVDVSPNNDWSAVRIALSDHGRLGSIYPTYGFIYARPDDGMMLANNTRTQAHARYVAAHHHSAADEFDALRHPLTSTEVAEAPEDALPVDAPNRSIR